MRGVVPLFSDDELGRLTMPTLLIGGAKMSFATTRRLQRVPVCCCRMWRPLFCHYAGHALLNVTDLIADFLSVAAPVAEA